MYSPTTVVSYAQNNEDVVLGTILEKVKKGFYVDVGANHPTRHSVTKNFYDRGWTGINIEPNPMLYKMLAKERPKDVNLNVGISDKEGELILRLYHSRDGLEGLSTFSDEAKQQNSKKINEDNKNFSDITVKVKKLSTVFTENSVKTIHFMKVDVEGLEYAVLISNNWKQFRPHVLCIEANHLMSDWHDVLKNAKYQLIYTDGLNEYFVANEVKQQYNDRNLPEEIVSSSSDILKQHQYELWQTDIKNIKTLNEVVNKLQTESQKLQKLVTYLERLSALTLKDQRLIVRIKRAIYGLTVDWLRYKKSNTSK